MFELGGSLWVPIVVLGPVLLAVAMIYGIMRWRRSPGRSARHPICPTPYLPDTLSAGHTG